MSNVDLITNTTSAKYDALIDQAFASSGDISFDRTLYGTRTYSDRRVVPNAQAHHVNYFKIMEGLEAF